MPLIEAVPRQALAAALKPLLPKRWRLIERLEEKDEVDKTTVRLKHLGIERSPAAPTRVHDNRFVVTITSAVAGTIAEDQLDDDVSALLHALDSAHITWTSAEKVVDNNKLAWDITVMLPTVRTPAQ